MDKQSSVDNARYSGDSDRSNESGLVPVWGDIINEQERIQRMCGDKVRHTKNQAKSAAQSMNAKDPAIIVKAYRCPYCNNWHVGRQRT